MSSGNIEKEALEAQPSCQQDQGKTNHGIVTLTTDPWLKPLVCGICGHQFDSGRGLDVHLRSHKIGTKSPGRPPKSIPVGSQSDTDSMTPKKRGRKPGSKAKLSDSVVETVEERPPGSLRRSSRAPKRASWLQQYLVPKMGGYDDDDIVEEPQKSAVEKVEEISSASTSMTSADGNENFSLKDGSESIVQAPVSGECSDTPALMTPAELPALPLNPTVTEGVVDPAEKSSNPSQGDDAGVETNEVVTTPQVEAELRTETKLPVVNIPPEDLETIVLVAEKRSRDEDSDDPDFVDDENDSDYDGKPSYKRQRKYMQQKKECDVCGKMLGTSHMKRHMLAVHLNQKDFVCDREGCDKKFAVVTELKYHILSVHDKATSKECTLCGKFLSDAHSLKTHMKNRHTVKPPEKEVVCNVCGRVFRNIRACSSHMKQHTMERKPTECDKCGRTFVNPSKLQFHQKVNPHCNMVRHVCDLCGYKASSPWRLNNHLQQTHSLARNFECEHCHKCFKTKEMVKNHIYKVHTGTPSLSCEHCDRKFFYKAELKEHIQIHSNKRPFSCSICHQSFKTLHVLRGHLMGKHSDTWFSCGFCKFTTSHKKSMKRHMKLVHKLTNVQLEVTVEEQPPVPEQAEALYISSEDGTVQVHIPDDQVQVEELEHTINSSNSGNMHVLTSGGTLDVEGGQFTPSCSTVEEVSEVLVALGNMAESAGFQVREGGQEIAVDGSTSHQEVYVATQNIPVSETTTHVLSDSELVNSIILNAGNARVVTGEKSGDPRSAQVLSVSEDGVVFVTNGDIQ